MMFPVEFRIHIDSDGLGVFSNNEDVMLIRRGLLPFAPTIGLFLDFGGYGDEAKEVEYLIQTNSFIVYFDRDRPGEDYKRTPEEMQERVHKYISEWGWDTV